MVIIFEDENDTDKAYDYYKKTLLYAPNHYWANLNLGSIYEKNNKFDLAILHTKKAYEINPNEKMAAYNLGVINGKLKNYQEAINYYLDEMKRKNCFMMAYLNIALIYKEIYHDYDTAKYYYIQGIARDKDNSTLWYNLGCLYVIINDYENGYNCLLYANIKDQSIKEYMAQDEELAEFKKSDLYKKLLKEIKG